MLRMDKVYVIRHKVLKEGKSMRETAREMGVSRNTVKKYTSVSIPSRCQKAQKRSSVREEVAPRIDQILEEWSTRTTEKQRITGTRVHQQLLKEGYQVGITTVREYLREKKRQKAEVFIPLVHRPGEEVQIDFFEVTVDIGGIRQKAWMFVMRLMYSGRDFVWIYKHCDQVSFLDGHVRAFEHFGGVPSRCVYDNLKAAVSKMMFPERKLSERFMAIASHYLFEPNFARPRTGHDKGGVEARGKGIRWQHLTPIPQGKTLALVCQELLMSVDEQAKNRKDREGRTVLDKFEEEKSKLRSLPSFPFEAERLAIAGVSSQATVQVEGATYSVPCHWKHLEAMVYVRPTELRFVCKGEEVRRPRVAAKEKQIQYLDYLPELAKKPQALRQVATELLEELPEPFTQLWKLLESSLGGLETARLFTKLLRAIQKHGQVEVQAALEEALAAEQVHLLGLARFLREPPPAELQVPESLASYEVQKTSAADFDFLLKGGEV